MDMTEVAKWLGWALMALLTFLSGKLWTDVRELQRTLWTDLETLKKAQADSIKQNDLNRAVDLIRTEVKADITRMEANTAKEREARTADFNENFRRIEDLVRRNSDTWNQDYRQIIDNLNSVKIVQAEQGRSLQIERRNLNRRAEDNQGA